MDILFHFIMFLFIFGQVETFEWGKIADWWKRSLKKAGCDEKGRLLGHNVCVNSDYDPMVPPNDTMTIYNTIKDNKVARIDELGGKLELRMTLDLYWEDWRITTNQNEHDQEKNGTKENNKLWLKYLMDGKKNWPHIWCPQNQKFAIQGQIKMKGDDEEGFGKWGLLRVELVNPNPFHDSVPLFNASMRFKVTIPCNFDYKNYPMKPQICVLRIVSNTFDPLQLVLYDPENGTVQDEKYEYQGFLISTKLVNGTDEDKIGIDINLERPLQQYILQYYVPSIIIVIISQTSFVIPLSAIPGRISLVVTTFLALTNIFINQQSESPTKTQFTAIGIYVLVSLFFVMATLVQLTMVVVLKRRAEKRNQSRVGASETFKRNTIIEAQTLVEMVDLVFMISFPITFVSFNVVYWSVMLD